MIKKIIRPNDFACRYGGEEFLVILPRTSCHQVKIPAERIRNNIYKESLKLNQKDETFPAV